CRPCRDRLPLPRPGASRSCNRIPETRRCPKVAAAKSESAISCGSKHHVLEPEQESSAKHRPLWRQTIKGWSWGMQSFRDAVYGSCSVQACRVGRSRQPYSGGKRYGAAEASSKTRLYRREWAEISFTIVWRSSFL